MTRLPLFQVIGIQGEQMTSRSARNVVRFGHALCLYLDAWWQVGKHMLVIAWTVLSVP